MKGQPFARILPSSRSSLRAAAWPGRRVGRGGRRPDRHGHHVAPHAGPGGNVANWARRAVGEQAGQFHRSYDRAKDEYHVALLADDKSWDFFVPENRTFQNFTPGVEVYQIAGSDMAGYGLAFRRQKADGDARYVFYVTAQGRFALTQI